LRSKKTCNKKFEQNITTEKQAGAKKTLGQNRQDCNRILEKQNDRMTNVREWEKI